ncbi:MAG: PhnD/SsuA/transferrin family substrate-binding protein [Zavarzinella sp.]
MRSLIVFSCLLLVAPGTVVCAERVNVGIPASVFKDIPKPLLSFATQPFDQLIQSRTGYPGDAELVDDALTIAKHLDSGKYQLGVFQAHEFAWAKDKFPKLMPLVICVPKPREIQAFGLVRYDHPAKDLGECKGQKLVIADTTRDHVLLYLDKQRTNQLVGSSFTHLKNTKTAHDAIHLVIDGEADITFTDGASWSYFQKLYPGPAQNLKVLLQSKVFPSTVIAYKTGGMPDQQVTQCQKGLLTAHEDSKCKRLMGTIKLDRFEAIPADYLQVIESLRKEYPNSPTMSLAGKP